MVLAANALRAAITHLQLHSGDPGSSGTSNLTTASRQSVTWSAATSNGDFGLSAPIEFTGVTPSGDCTYVSAWSAITGGTHYGNFALSGDTEADGAGKYTLTALDLDGSAS